jgi:hypothetical protein
LHRTLTKFLQCNASERMLRLFSCACCRRIMKLLPDERSQRAVELSAGFGDGMIARDDLILAAQNAGGAAEAAHWENRPGPIQTAALSGRHEMTAARAHLQAGELAGCALVGCAPTGRSQSASRLEN